MIVRNVTQVGNPLIRAKAKPVSSKSKAAAKIVKDLIASMRHHGLVGMAAPQIGKGVRIFVTEVRKTKYRKPEDVDGLRVFLNPRILSFSRKEIKGWEGCGSVATGKLFGSVKRPSSLTVSAHDQNGEKFVLEAGGTLARVIQHEMDHLNGRVFTDLADLKSYMSHSEYLKMMGRKR